MTTKQRVVVAVFTSGSMAEQAINDLLNAGFSNDQIRFEGQGAATDGILSQLKSLFSGQKTASDFHDDLLDMGVPEGDAHCYEDEYKAGRCIVAVLADGQIQEAIAILARYGGHGVQQPYSQAAYSATSAPDYAPDYAQTSDTTPIEGK